MSTRTLGMPADLRRRLEYILPRQRGTYPPFVRVTPRDADERRCAAWASDHYEVHAFYTTSDTGSLAALEAAFQDVPGVYLTTQVGSSGCCAASPPTRSGACGPRMAEPIGRWTPSCAAAAWPSSTGT